MTEIRLDIDHIGVLAPSIAALVDEFADLGFQIVGPAELTAVAADGRRTGLGQYSAHIMFSDTYIELTAVEKPRPGHHLEPFMRMPWGIRLLILKSTDIQATHAACVSRGLRPGEIQRAIRHIDYGSGGTARFRWFGLPDGEQPDALIAYVEHETPERVFQAEVASHDNGAIRLTRLYYAAAEMPAHLIALAGPAGQAIECVPEESARTTLGFSAAGCVPVSAAGIAVSDVAATAEFLRARGIDLRSAARGVAVRLQSGAIIVFEQAAATRAGC